MELLYTAITTPFVNNKVDIQSLGDHIQFLLANQSGVVLFGTTGECPTLTESERLTILTMVSQKFDDKSKFVIGVGGNNTQKCIENVNVAVGYGFSNIMITAPYYNKPTQEGLFMHFTEISKAHNTLCNTRDLTSNVILYNVPGRSVVNIQASTVKKICDECSNVVAIKEASGNLSQVISIRSLVPKIKVYSGDDALAVPIMSVGGCGLISVVSNLFPSQVYNVLDLCKKNRYDDAFSYYSKLHDFTEAMFCETNPVPIKYALTLTHRYKSSEVRLPLTELTDANKEKVQTSVKPLFEEVLKEFFAD
jgi:4-hydroxy-tetrahydrodipicolinate synthase